MPIRLRLALSGVAVAGLTVLLFGVGVDRLATYSAPQDQDRQLSKLAERAAAAIAKARPAGLEAGLSPVAGDAATSTDPFVAILGANGKLLYSSARLDGALESLSSTFVAASRRDGSAAATIRTRSGIALRVQARPWKRPDLGLSGLVVAGQARRVAGKQASDFRAFLIIAGVVTLLIAGLATWIVSGRALRPLRRLAATADEIGRTGDLARRLPPARPKDVMGLLTESFNGMLDRLGSAQARLEEALEAQRRFVADASHELRTPLTTITSNAGFLLERPDALPADRTDALADIAAEAERVGRLVDDLLALARTDAGRLEPRPVELGKLVRDAAHGWRNAGRPIRLVLDGSVVATGDPDALERLARILIDNAIRHGAGEVELTVSRVAEDAVLTVADRGPGIPQEELERIFDRFYQADPSRRSNGVGLGLAIARSIAGAHQGSIAAQNRPEGGAVFVVRLPQKSVPASA